MPRSEYESMEELDNAFTYHPPQDSQADRYEALREEGRKLAYAICTACPECAERDIAIDKVREAIMWVNAGIACKE